MKECYNVYYMLKLDGGKEYVLGSGFCYKENSENVTVHFDTFDKMFEWVKDTECDGIRVNYTLFRKKRYISWGWDGYYMNEKNFSPCSVIKEYKIYYPSMSRAMELLTVEQFREYWESKGRKKCPQN